MWAQEKIEYNFFLSICNFYRQQLRPQLNMQPPNPQSGPNPMFSGGGSNSGPGQQQMFANMPQGKVFYFLLLFLLKASSEYY